MKGSGMGPAMAWQESQIAQPQPPQANGVREREGTVDNQRLKRRPSPGSLVTDGSMSMPVASSTPLPTPAERRLAGKDALSFAAILRSRNKFAGKGFAFWF